MENENSGTDYRLSLSADTFGALKQDFDTSLRALINAMEQKEAEDGSLALKLDVKLMDLGGQKSPLFAHKVTTVLQLKASKTGLAGGVNYELVWDNDAADYVMRPIPDDQTSMYDGDAEDKT